MCILLGKRVHSPGVELIGRMETGPRNSSWHKDISLGKICCERVCKCEIVYKKAVNRTLSTIEHVIDLTANLTQRALSYYCEQELDECVNDCKLAAGVHLKSEQLQESSVSPLSIEVFSQFQTARRACVLLNRTTTDASGVNVFLKYSTRLDGEENADRYPAAQELLLGNLCCDPLYFNIALFPFHKCKMWNLDDLPFDLEDRRLIE